MRDSTLKHLIALHAELEARFSAEDDFYELKISRSYIVVNANGKVHTADRHQDDTPEQLAAIISELRESCAK